MKSPPMYHLSPVILNPYVNRTCYNPRGYDAATFWDYRFLMADRIASLCLCGLFGELLFASNWPESVKKFNRCQRVFFKFISRSGKYETIVKQNKWSECAMLKAKLISEVFIWSLHFFVRWVGGNSVLTTLFGLCNVILW